MLMGKGNSTRLFLWRLDTRFVTKSEPRPARAALAKKKLVAANFVCSHLFRTKSKSGHKQVHGYGTGRKDGFRELSPL